MLINIKYINNTGNILYHIDLTNQANYVPN